MSTLGAIVRYEVLMAWRRRSLPILWILLLAGVIGFSLLIADVNQRQPIVEQAFQQNTAADAPEWAQGIDLVEAAHTVGLINVLIAGMVFYTVGVTLLMGEVIPLDKQFKVRELLDTLPISRATYLGGKLLSAWAGLLAGMAVIGVVCALALRLIFGAYDLRVFVALWVAMLFPTSFIAAGLSVLASSLVGTRRGAVLMGLAILPVVLFLATLAVPSFAGVGALIQPIYAIGILMMPGADTNAEIVSRIVNTLAIYGAVLVLVWTFVWLRERTREAG